MHALCVCRDCGFAVTASSAKQLLEVTSADPVCSAASLLRFSNAQDACLPLPDSVLCTRNFLHATTHSFNGSSSLNEYPRPVGVMLVFSDAMVLLVSDREADALVAVARAHAALRVSSASPAPPVLVNQCFAYQAWQSGTGAQLALALPLRGSAARTVPGATCVAAAAVAAVRLFDGQTTYGGLLSAVHRELRRLVSGPDQARGAKDVCVDLVNMRGKESLFSHSDLEKACDDGGGVLP